MFENGLFIARNVFDEKEVEALREAFFDALDYCTELQKRHGVFSFMQNTVHHVLFLNPIFQDLIIKPNLNELICEFFEGKKYVLNSFGGNNNTEVNYIAPSIGM